MIGLTQSPLVAPRASPGLTYDGRHGMQGEYDDAVEGNMHYGRSQVSQYSYR